MKKIHLIVHKKDVVYALEEIRGLGIVHVEHQDLVDGYQLQERREEVAVVQRSIDILRQVGSDVAQTKAFDWTEVTNDILKAQGEIEEIKDQMAKRQLLISQWEPWGDFNPDDIKKLSENNVFVDLYQVPAASIDKLRGDFVVTTIGVKGGVALCVVVARSKLNLAFDKVALPPFGLGVMKAMQEADRIKMEQAQKRIADHSCHIEFLEMTLQERENILRFEEVEQGMLEDGPVAVLKGFCPAVGVERLERRAKEQRWALLVEAPDAGDAVPTLLENPRWVKMIHPVFDFMNIIPGYQEADVSFCFLLFFSIFFGMLIGDAGYGVLFALAAGFFHFKNRKSVSDPKAFFLIYSLSLAAIVWGLLTGTFFGVSLFGKVVKPIVPWLAEERNVQLLCFIIGAGHLTIAHMWRGIRKLPSLLCLSDLGWIAIVWGAFFYAKQFILDVPVPAFVNPMGLVAFIVIILFSQKFEDVLKDFVGFGIGILLTVLTVISTLIDVISYIRLYAVGIAGLSLAEAFNQMALAAGFKNFFVGLAAVAILVAGHGLNIILGMMAIMVHGLRLNILEFSGHLSLEWSGVKYQPFRRINEKSH